MAPGWHSPRGQETTSHLIPGPGALAHGGWLVFPTLPNCSSSIGAQCSDSCKFTPVRHDYLFLLFPFFLPCFPLAPLHTPFCRKTFPKFKTLRGNRGEREQGEASCNTSPLSQASTMQLPCQLRPAANLPISPRAQTKPVRPETGLPAPTCPKNAVLVRNVSGKAEGPRNQSPSPGSCQRRAIINRDV